MSSDLDFIMSRKDLPRGGVPDEYVVLSLEDYMLMSNSMDKAQTAGLREHGVEYVPLTLEALEAFSLPEAERPGG